MKSKHIIVGMIIFCGSAAPSAFASQEKKSDEDDGWFELNGKETPDGELAKRDVPLEFKKIRISGTRAGPRTIEKLRTTRSIEELYLGHGFANEGLHEVGKIGT